MDVSVSGIGSHERGYRGFKDEWLTPRFITDALGPFDLDPCSPVDRPWGTASRHLTIDDDGLSSAWDGCVWMNPPYGPETGKWLSKLCRHGNGIALVFARTETMMFFEYVWSKASGLLFLRGRVRFHHVSGEVGKSSSTAPSVLISYGGECRRRLKCCALDGHFVQP